MIDQTPNLVGKLTVTQRIAKLIATGLGFGFAPIAPGTVGALWGLPLAWLVAKIPGWPTQVITIVALCLLGVPICTTAARALGRKDPKEVVWDEIASMPVAFFLVPTRLMSRPEILVLGFALHRLFDITKPSPVRNVEKLPEGAGIMADDVVAAVYACVCLHALLWLFPWLVR